MRGIGAFSLSKKGGALFLQKSFRSVPRVFTHKMRENTLSPRKVFFATYTPNGSPLGGRRREKWIKPYSRPAGRELCEAFLTGKKHRCRASVLFCYCFFI